MLAKQEKRPAKIRFTASDYAFHTLNWIALILFFLLIAYPLLYIIFASFSGGAATSTLSLLPEKWSLEGYKAVLEYKYIWIGYRNSLFYMVAGTAIALCMTIFCAYPLSRSDFRGGGLMMGLCVFTMYFGGGLIPTYLWMRSLGLYNSVWALLLPGSLSVYNMIVMRTYFKNQIPQELMEASYLDGCGDLRYLLRIVLPLSGPVLAVIGLYYAVGIWNSYFDAMIYLQDRAKLPLSMFLREILVLNNFAGLDTAGLMDGSAMEKMERRAEIMKYSVIIVSSLPVMILYPFVQKYFVRGIMIGAVKG